MPDKDFTPDEDTKRLAAFNRKVNYRPNQAHPTNVPFEKIKANVGKPRGTRKQPDGIKKELLQLASLVGTDAKNPEEKLLAYIEQEIIGEDDMVLDKDHALYVEPMEAEAKIRNQLRELQRRKLRGQDG